MKRNLAQQAEDVEQLLRLRFSFFWQLWGGDGAASQGCLTGLPHRAASQGCLTGLPHSAGPAFLSEHSHIFLSKACVGPT